MVRGAEPRVLGRRAHDAGFRARSPAPQLGDDVPRPSRRASHRAHRGFFLVDDVDDRGARLVDLWSGAELLVRHLDEAQALTLEHAEGAMDARVVAAGRRRGAELFLLPGALITRADALGAARSKVIAAARERGMSTERRARRAAAHGARLPQLVAREGGVRVPRGEPAAAPRRVDAIARRRTPCLRRRPSTCASRGRGCSRRACASSRFERVDGAPFDVPGGAMGEPRASARGGRRRGARTRSRRRPTARPGFEIAVTQASRAARARRSSTSSPEARRVRAIGPQGFFTRPREARGIRPSSSARAPASRRCAA